MWHTGMAVLQELHHIPEAFDPGFSCEHLAASALITTETTQSLKIAVNHKALSSQWTDDHK